MERVTQFPNTGPVSMPTVNHELNRIVGLVQQLNHEVEELSEEIGYTDERALDAVATALNDGAGIEITYDDANDEIHIASTIDAEYIRDTVAAQLVSGVGIELVEDDVANTLTINTTGGGGGARHDDTQQDRERVSADLKRCYDNWEPSTHMSRSSWNATCKRMIARGRLGGMGPR